jgi:hypothetical protein
MAAMESMPDVRRRLYEALVPQTSIPAERLLPVIRAETDIAARVAGFNVVGNIAGQEPSSTTAATFDKDIVPELLQVATSANDVNLEMRAVFALRRAQTAAAQAALAGDRGPRSSANRHRRAQRTARRQQILSQRSEPKMNIRIQNPTGFRVALAREPCLLHRSVRGRRTRDDFNDNIKNTSKWGLDDKFNHGVLTEKNQRLEYTCTCPDARRLFRSVLGADAISRKRQLGNQVDTGQHHCAYVAQSGQ